MLHQLYSGSACDYFRYCADGKEREKGLAIGGIITAVISIVLGIAVSLYAVNIAEKMQDPGQSVLSVFLKNEQKLEEGKEFFLAGSYKGEPVYRFSFNRISMSV